jgi:hypothetical protein
VASVKIKLKVPATQHHRRKRPAPAHWRAISNVRFLFGLTTYISRNAQRSMQYSYNEPLPRIIT